MGRRRNPVQITELAPNKRVVRIRQVVRALDGLPISKGWFEHTHQIEDGVIVRMWQRHDLFDPRRHD